MFDIQPTTGQPYREPGAAVSHIIIGSTLVNERLGFFVFGVYNAFLGFYNRNRFILGFEPETHPPQIYPWAREKIMKKTVTMNILLRFAIVCNFLQDELH